MCVCVCVCVCARVYICVCTSVYVNFMYARERVCLLRICACVAACAHSRYRMYSLVNGLIFCVCLLFLILSFLTVHQNDCSLNYTPLT